MPLISNQKRFTSTSTQDVLFVSSTASTIGTPYILAIDGARLTQDLGLRVTQDGGVRIIQ